MSETPKLLALMAQSRHLNALEYSKRLEVLVRELERENAALRADKERLDSGIIRLRSDNGWGMVWCIHKGMDLRAAIDAARKEAQP